MKVLEESPTGLVFWGCAASEATDSSGERISVEGIDISDFENQVAQLNWEHENPDDEDYKEKREPADEIVGRILTGYKVFKESDCRNEYDKKQWENTELPFVSVICRLYDGAGHRGAQNLAAIMRDHHANGEKILARLSIEGSTLDRDKNDKNKITSSVAKMCAITIKPCNRTCDTALIVDPNAPKGFDKEPGKPDILADLVQKNEVVVVNPVRPDRVRLSSVDCELEEVQDVKKALTAGSYSAAPSQLTGGSALQVEDKSFKNRLRRVVDEYAGPKSPFSKAEFVQFAKAALPDVSDGFIDHFSDIAHDFYAKKMKKSEEDEGEESPVSKEPHNLTKLGKKLPTTTAERPFFDEKKGVLHIPASNVHSGGQLKMYIPQGKEAASFENIMQDPKINKFHGYAMDNWKRLHQKLKEGSLPPEILMHATLFSNLSPNTPVKIQELMFGHLTDSMKHTGIDARHPEFQGVTGPDWLSRDTPDKLPSGSQEHWSKPGMDIRVRSKFANRPIGAIQSFMLANNKLANMAQYHRYHQGMEELVAKNKGDVRATAAELMSHKLAANLHEAKRQRMLAAGKGDIGEYTAGPVVAGLAPKTTRYLLGMVGGGNVHVPDTHFVRYLFGLDKSKDKHTISHLKNLLWDEKNGHVLEAIDRYYAKHHPAVRHLLDHPEFKGVFENPEDAIFPAFWKNWVGVSPHEKTRGLTTKMASNEFTDHQPYWDAVEPFVKSEETEWSLPARTATLHHIWANKYGEVPALAMYYAYLVPKLLAHHATHTVNRQIVKAEAAIIDLKKAAEDFRDVLPEPVVFRGRKITPGLAFTSKGKHSILHEDDTHYTVVPWDKRMEWEPEDLKRFPKSKEGTHFWVSERPSVPVQELS